MGLNDALTQSHTNYVYIDSITSDNGFHSFLALNGGNNYTYVSHVYAEANNQLNSVILSIPQQVPRIGGGLAGNAFGVTNFFLSDSNFEGFARGIPIEEFQFSFSNAFFSNLYLDTAVGGPSLEIMAISRSDGGSTNVSNISIANSLFSSSSSACIAYGQVSNIQMSNVTCNGAEADIVPTPTPSPSPACTKYPDSQRGEAYVLYGTVSATFTPAGSVSVTLTVPPAAPTTFTATAAASDHSVGDVVSHLAQAISSNTAFINGCPPMISPVAIGPLLPIRSFVWGGSDTPSVSATASAPLTVVEPATAGTYTFSPSDVFRIDGHSSWPQQLSVTTSAFSGAGNGSGVHFYGGNNILFSDDRMNNEGAPTNMFGVTFDPGGTYTNVILNADDLSKNLPTPGAIQTPLPSSGVYIANVPAVLQASPLPNPSPTLMCSTTYTNPFPFSVEALVYGNYNAVLKDRVVLWPAGSFADVRLRVGENFSINCSGSTLPSVSWFAQ